MDSQRLEALRDLVCEQLGVQRGEVTESAAFIADFGADSLDLTELVMNMEERFAISIPESETATIVTVGDALKLLERVMLHS